MATVNGESYTNFRAVNVKEGVIRVADKTATTNAYGVTLRTADGILTGSRKVYVCDGSGSMVLMGYDILYGSATFLGNGNIAANSIGQASVSITGVVATSVVLVSAATSAQVAGYVPIGSKYAAANKIWVFYVVKGSAATTVVPINYTVLFPQTT